MPLLEIIQTRQISASIRLDEATATQVDQYAAFIHATADDVVDKALNYVFSKDRDFQEFLKTVACGSRSAQSPYPQSRRCGCSGTCREEDGRRGGVHSCCAWTEGVIQLQIHLQKHNGATHRKKYDTPPLKGYALEPGFLVRSLRNMGF